ncbi:tRNA guanylyltransferase [Sphaerulina musiva SO2202]|uniref:tRNA(His) guanylyltransferase n=1 Tax=Sphaerulina musiva (strain SO2202) TaxID=692275 RepID=M3B2S0_SPHMS|nr:tRNA guanylyltransferase [Sphaerulina musiva SO2202]EMF14077.1 tRNA guanylyltransferase [Sphaerulina musiva SO2202]
MANTEFSYVKTFESNDVLPPSQWIVIRIDGRGFSKLCIKYNFQKPNDARLMHLMNSAAERVLQAFPDMVLAYGQSDEFSFVLHEDTRLFERRSAKLSSSVATMFTAEFCMGWVDAMGVEVGGDGKLERPWPTFDGRCICYPKKKIIRDYLAWRQADCHINNLYNTTFWNLVLKGGMSGTEAEQELKGSVASDKNEILWSRFGVNYNQELEVWRKGTVMYRVYDDVGGGGGGEEKGVDAKSKSQLEKERKRKMKAKIVQEHTDIIGDGFWEKRPYILATRGAE